MKISTKIYLRAAKEWLKREDSDGLSCVAISCASEELQNQYFCVERDAYRKLFCPIEYENAGYWLVGHLPEGEEFEWRLTALCFAAAMAKAGDL